MKASEVPEHALQAISDIERACSVLSLLGCTFILITFAYKTGFRKPINRLIFYASMGNWLTNVATCISRSPLAGKTTAPLCQFQAMLIQMFMPADAYWTMAMATNVWLTFYKGYGADDLRRLEPYYAIACFGVPMIPGFVYLFIHTTAKGHFYGNATLWCWVSTKWDIWRIITFYGPVWVTTAISITIYLSAGYRIYMKHKELQAFSRFPTEVGSSASATITASMPPSPARGRFLFNRTTDVVITSCQATASTQDDMEIASIIPQTLQQPGSDSSLGYTVHVSASPPTSCERERPCPLTQHGQPAATSITSNETLVSDPAPHVRESARVGRASTSQKRDSKLLRYLSPSGLGSEAGLSSRRRKLLVPRETNRAALAYLKVAVLFFFAMMITWIPSSANRVYSLVHPEEVSLTLLYGSAFVLPLQGFWNFIIYVTTSKPACLDMWRDIVALGRTRPSLRFFCRPAAGSANYPGPASNSTSSVAAIRGNHADPLSSDSNPTASPYDYPLPLRAVNSIERTRQAREAAATHSPNRPAHSRLKPSLSSLNIRASYRERGARGGRQMDEDSTEDLDLQNVDHDRPGRESVWFGGRIAQPVANSQF